MAEFSFVERLFCGRLFPHLLVSPFCPSGVQAAIRIGFVHGYAAARASRRRREQAFIYRNSYTSERLPNLPDHLPDIFHAWLGN
jgi:hypothetical protein